ncbi:rod shape-determining protein MreC [Aurantibacter sp.]|uniref:rod shape-determining protein MreC n=1 Tax=Aurantibacter sp. TaxID=2807103 RepID=UPI0035C85C6C
MQQILNFFLRNKATLLFLLLFGLSLTFTIQLHSFQKSQFIHSANFLSGGVYNTTNNISKYFDLIEENKKLQEENSSLRALIFKSSFQTDSIYIDSTSYNTNYKVTPAILINNSYTKANNTLLINKGLQDGIEADLGVISSKGIVGITRDLNSKYTTVISILNTTISISAKLKKTNHYGSIKWDTKNPRFVQLTEIPKNAPLKKGDTILTSGNSSIFPKNIPVGTITNFKLDTAENFYIINVELFNDMNSLDHVYVIKNEDKKLINQLINPKDE